MTQAKAASIAQLAINQGFTCRIFKRPDGEWIVHIYSTSFSFDVTTASNFAQNNSINGLAQEIEFV